MTTTPPPSEPAHHHPLPPPKPPWYRNPNTVRTLVMFVSGLAGLFYEAVLDNGDKPTLIIAFLALMGFPVFLSNKKDD